MQWSARRRVHHAREDTFAPGSVALTPHGAPLDWFAVEQCSPRRINGVLQVRKSRRVGESGCVLAKAKIRHRWFDTLYLIVRFILYCEGSIGAAGFDRLSPSVYHMQVVQSPWRIGTMLDHC